MGNKYFSNVISAEDIIKSEHNKICIIAGVGSGKNWFVENELIKYGNILYITSRRAKVNEILEEKVAQEFISWNNETGDIVTTTNFGIEKLVMNEKFEGRLSEIIKHFSFVVIDEAHSLFTDATYTEAPFHVNTFLNYISDRYPNIKILLMTGTPEPLSDYLQDYQIIDKREECINIVPTKIRFITKKQALELLYSVSDNEKTIYFTTSARGLVSGKNSIYQKLLASGKKPQQISICMSDTSISKNKGHLSNLAEICLHTKSSITQKRTLPEESNVLLTTSTLKEGVNIEDNSIKIAFCESHLLSDIQQFAGRVRTVLDTLYIITDSRQHDVAEKIYKSYMLESLFCYREICPSSNKFLEEKIKDTNSTLYSIAGYNAGNIDWELVMQDEYSLYSYGGDAIKAFINLVENRNKYVRFNHLLGEFNYYKNRFIEQKRVHSAIYGQGWIKELENYCKTYNIDYNLPIFEEIIDTDDIYEHLQSIQDIMLFDKERDDLKVYLSKSFHLTSSNPQIGTLNKKLLEYDIAFEIKRGGTSKNGCPTRYLKVVSK